MKTGQGRAARQAALFVRSDADVHERPLLIYSVAALLLGAHMMSIGFLDELITAYQSRDEDSYSIAESTKVRSL